MSDLSRDNLQAEIIFYDDFNLGKLDRTKWTVMITEEIYNNEQQAYIDSSETIYISTSEKFPGARNGVLVIHPRYRPGFSLSGGKFFDFVSGRIHTRGKFEFMYGSASARMMLPFGSGLWPAFWLLGHDSWPDSGEIDIMEYVGESDWVSAALHGPGYYGEAGLVNKFFYPTKEDATTWHIYSVDWFPDKVVFKVDDRTVYRVTRPMTDFFGPWVFNNYKFLILNFALGGTYPFKTNGIQTPYYGIPDQTVRLIMDNKIKIAIDWVRVTKNEFTGDIKNLNSRIPQYG